MISNQKATITFRMSVFGSLFLLEKNLKIEYWMLEGKKKQNFGG